MTTSTPTAERLREAMREATERAMDEGYEPHTHVLAALVRETGLSWEMVEALEAWRRELDGAGYVLLPEGLPHAVVSISAILEAAGIPREETK